MKNILYFILVCFAFSCRKDPMTDHDNSIEIDNVIYFRQPDSGMRYNSSMSPPYYSGVAWNGGNDNTEIAVEVANTCTNNRGALSNFHGFISYHLRHGNDSVDYYGKFPLFELHQSGDKTTISFRQLKLYRRNNFNNFIDSSNFKMVTGKVTFK
jgi:hypothetical protein